MVAAGQRWRWWVERARGEEIGVTLVQIKTMQLANVQTFGSNVWRPNINLSAPQIDFSCGADRKMVIFYVYLRNIKEITTQIKKN